MHFPAEIFHHKPFGLLSGMSIQQDVTSYINSNPKQRTSAMSLFPHRCLHECMWFMKAFWKMESRGWTHRYIQRPQGIWASRKKEGSQKMLISYNGPDTLLTDRYQEILALRGQVTGSQSQGGEWSSDTNWVLHLSSWFPPQHANPCGNFWI